MEAEFEQEALDRLHQIDLKVGLLSNVEPVLMQNAFKAFTEDQTRYASTELKVTVMPILVECELCGDISEVKNYAFRCGNGHTTKNIIQGDELTIERVHFRE